MFWKSELKQTVEQGPAVALDGVPSFLDEIKEMPGGRDGSSGVSGASKGLENALQAALRDARVLGEEIAGVLRLRRQTVGPQEIGDGEVQATVAELQDQIASWEARMKEALAMHEREQHERQDLHHRFRHLDEVRKAIDSANAEILYRHAHSAQQELQAQKERELEAKAMALVADLEVLRKSAAEEAAALRQRIREMEVKARQQRSKQPSKPRKPGWSCWLRTFRSSLQSEDKPASFPTARANHSDRSTSTIVSVRNELRGRVDAIRVGPPGQGNVVLLDHAQAIEKNKEALVALRKAAAGQGKFELDLTGRTPEKTEGRDVISSVVGLFHPKKK